MTTQTMKAWRLHDRGLDNLKLEDIEVPVPGPGELLIRVGAVALNYRDQAIVSDYYDPNMLKSGPLTLVGDCAGSIVQIGNEVTRFKVGERVATHLYSQWLDGNPRPNESHFLLGGPLPGGLAEYMIIPDYAAVATPGHLSDEQACTLPVAGLTAWFALTNWGTINKGDFVLVQGTGGVSMFAIQIANALGAKVIVTTSSDKKGKRAKSLGASHVINYVKHPNWGEIALQLTNGKGVDQVVEVVGGDTSLNQSILAAKVEGLITVVGFLEDMHARVFLLPLILKQVRIQGMVVGHRRAFDAMRVFFEDNKIVPVIDTVYPFDQVHDAFYRLKKGAFGKIVISICQQNNN